jgi:hypothetical protein
MNRAVKAAQPAEAERSIGSAEPPAWFVSQALCVHSGWHWRPARTRAERRRGEYWLSGKVFIRLDDVPDGIAGGSGEAAWNEVNSYGGGMQFTIGTWNRAAGLSRGAVPYASATSAIATMPARVQIFAAYLIVRSDGGSWREWPQTSRACGYR